ncbi:hypothetical protein L1787_18510 [Acuticoccus sp. M5D2P5]|uniref:hypothetical protein n=1 Tax=Acuticoccus kalidii TaxID=2910977 RepID=UPI001F3A93A4|nr:hypothetical protein [Acuticoccus kalidii]MCF3931841.1 hypothetical protein [Acuticoccus kalidii]MCF3933309.1 hypothetical protein [Acuticoccus kalidii]MCF3934357.1 hypothetical protein [Acuticoccus kalidii]MCF3935386.1 hypothetical protein [Acuticoccus kalidii]
MTNLTARTNADFFAALRIGDEYTRGRLDDWKIVMMIRESADAAGFLHAVSTTGGGLTITDPVGRTVEINIPMETIEAIGVGRYVYDLQLQNKTTEVRSSTPTGDFEIVQGISRFGDLA